MGRNNERNIKKHNDKLHKAQNKVKQAEIARKEKLKEIIEQVNSVCESSYPFHLTFESFKTIFKDRKPVMIWAQFAESREFDQLCFRLRVAFPTEEKRKPLPHLTLARIKQLRQLPFDLPKTKPYLPGGQAFSFEVNQLELWESHLDEKGATYEMIEQWKLGEK